MKSAELRGLHYITAVGYFKGLACRSEGRKNTYTCKTAAVTSWCVCLLTYLMTLYQLQTVCTIDDGVIMDELRNRRMQS